MSAERTTFASATIAGGSEIVHDLRLADVLGGQLCADLLRRPQEDPAADLDR
jgi:hypothetical protein